MYAVCETKFCGIIDQSLFYLDHTVHYIQNFENVTYIVDQLVIT